MPPKKQIRKPKRLSTIILIIVAVIAAFSAVHFYRAYQNIKKDPTTVSKQEVASVVAQVGKLMQLPTDETPTVATVQDVTKLKDQDFFKSAKNGDKLLAYTKAKTAILYRPSTNKVVKVAPIYISDNSSSVNVAIYNGTKNGDATNGVADKVKAAVATATISSTGDAASKKYTKTTVIDVTGSNSDAAQKIATALDGTVGSLPSGETAPSGASILVIVGE